MDNKQYLHPRKYWATVSTLLPLYEKFLDNIGVDPEVKKLIINQIKTRSRGAPLIYYILQNIANLTFWILINLVSIYIWEKLKPTRKWENKLETQLEELAKEIEKLKKEVKKMELYTKSANTYIKLAEILLNSKPEDMAKLIDDKDKEKIAKLIETNLSVEELPF